MTVPLTRKWAFFSEAEVQDSAFSSISIALGGETKNQGQAIAA
jgi:hypothetical protein